MTQNQPTALAARVPDGLPLVISGAIFDFAGFLTTREKVIRVGSKASAAPMADLVKEWAELRGLSLDDAAVFSWQEWLAAAPQPAQPKQEPTISTEHGPWIDSKHPGEEGEKYCQRCLLRNKFLGSRSCEPHIIYADTYPQPDDAALLQQALEALKYVDVQDKDRNFLDFDEWCRLDAIIAALKARLK